MRTMTLCALLGLAACDPVPNEDPEALLGATTETGLDAPASLRRALTGIDCGTLIPATAGTHLISEVSQLEAIDRSGCTSFSGNVKVAFTTALVPSSQRYLFDVKNIVSVSGNIDQTASTQSLQFIALQSAADIRLGGSGTCGFGALVEARALILGSRACSFPKLERADSIDLQSPTSLSGFNALKELGGLRVTTTKPLPITGFKALIKAGSITLEGASITGKFPVLETLGSLSLRGSDLAGFSLPKLTTVTGDISTVYCKKTDAPFPVLATVGGTWFQGPWSMADEIVGPAALKSLGGLQISSTAGLRVSGFLGLTTVSGQLTIHSDGEIRVSGFDALTSAGSVRLMSQYATISGFAKLAVIRGGLIVRTLSRGYFGEIRFTAFPVLAEIQDFVELYLDNPTEDAFPLLKRVGGNMSYREHDRPLANKGFAKLESVGGDLTVLNQSEAFNALKKVQGTLKLKDIPRGEIEGFRKLTQVGGDVIFDMRVDRLDAQQLVDRLIGFTGTVRME